MSHSPTTAKKKKKKTGKRFIEPAAKKTSDNKEDWKIQTPAQLQFLGPSQSGKSYRIIQLVAQQKILFDKPFRRVIYAAPGLKEEEEGEREEEEEEKSTQSKEKRYLRELQAACKAGGVSDLYVSGQVPSINAIKQLVDEEEGGGTLLILDDLLCFPNLEAVTNLSSRHAHHHNISCIFCLQNPFQRTPKTDLTTLGRNCTGIFILFQTVDWRLYTALNNKIFPDQPRFVLNCLLAAKQIGCNYIFVNTNSFTKLPRRYLCCTALFKGEAEKSQDAPIFFDLHQPPNSTPVAGRDFLTRIPC